MNKTNLKIKMNTCTVNTTILARRKIEWIVIHYTAGTSSAVGQAYSLAEWFKTGANPSNPASSDYIIDDETIVCYNPDIPNRYSWGAGGSKYAKMSTSEGGKYYGKCKNSNCINIEICSNKKNRKSLDANDTDWYFTDSELALAAELVKYLMDTYNIPADHVIMHHHVTGKLCPAMWTHNEAELAGWKKFQKMFGYSFAGESTENKESSNYMYYVQVGAFSSKENAQRYLEKVKKDYPGAFIKSDNLYHVQVGAFRSKANAEAFLTKVRKLYPGAFIRVM
ncbi:MAG: N-acetylmuramoyl-L-alanine amidase [Oscillospiraceae bacterium]